MLFYKLLPALLAAGSCVFSNAATAHSLPAGRDIQGHDLQNITAAPTAPLATHSFHQRRVLAKRTSSATDPSHTDDLSWDDAVANGKRNIEKLANSPNTDVAFTSWEVNYKDAVGTNYPDEDLKFSQSQAGFWPTTILSLLGVTKTTSFKSRAIFSKTSSNFPVSQNGYLPDQGIILALSNFKNADLNPPEKRLPSGEIMLQVWNGLAGDKKADLKWIARSHIVNSGTQSIIQESFTKLKTNPGELIHVTPDDNLEIFQALSGTANAKGVYPTLANHFQELNGPTITDIYAYYDKYFSGAYFIAMKIANECG